MKFLVPNYGCLQNPWLRGYRPRCPFSLSLTEFVEPPPPAGTKFLDTPLFVTISIFGLKFMKDADLMFASNFGMCQ